MADSPSKKPKRVLVDGGVRTGPGKNTLDAPKRVIPRDEEEPEGVSEALYKVFKRERPMFNVGLSSFKLPTGYLSVTQINMMLRCPMQYYRRYVLGQKDPPNIAMTEGIVHHDVLFEFNNGIIAHKPVKRSHIIDLFGEGVTAIAKVIDDWGDENEGSVRERGVLLLNRYLDEHDSLDVVKAEEPFTLTITEPGDNDFMNLPVVGVVDMATDDERVYDYKVVGRAKSQADADNDLQLSAYAMSGNTSKCSFMCFVKPSAAVVEVRTKRTPRDKGWFQTIALGVAHQIHAGIFPPCDPSQWVCSPKWCGFFHQCRGAK